MPAVFELPTVTLNRMLRKHLIMIYETNRSQNFIFAFVIHILLSFIVTYNPFKLHFTSCEPISL